jgi:formylglycine-generating enzyme
MVGWSLSPMKAALAFAVLLVAVLSQRTLGDTFGGGANAFDIEFVTISNPGNPADTTGDPNAAGSVPYSYRMGKFEISEQLIDKANALGGLGITKDTRGPDKPATSVVVKLDKPRMLLDIMPHLISDW